MDSPHSQRRGVVVGVSAFAGLAVAALGVVGIAQRADGAAQQQDVALTANDVTNTFITPPVLGDVNNPADAAHNDWITSQVNLDHQTFLSDVAQQQSIYYWAAQNNMASSLFPGNPADPEDSIYNGAFSRFTEAQLVGQAIQQAQLDHMLGVNQTLGAGGYETDIAQVLYNDLSGAGIPSTGSLHDAVEAIAPGSDFTSASGFVSDLTSLQNALQQSAMSDLFGMFSVGGSAAGESGGAAADAVSGLDLPL